jgi:hypothetical protein
MFRNFVVNMDSENTYEVHFAIADRKQRTQGFFEAIPLPPKVHWNQMLATPGL